MYVERHTVEITTDGSGAAEAYTPHVTGRLIDIQYVKNNFTDGVDFTITAEETGRSLWTDTNVNASEIVAPRQPTHDAAGAASLYAAGGEPIEDGIYLANERIKIVIAAGGSAKSGTFHITVA